MKMMMIGLDEERIDADGYEPKSLWDWVDEVFALRKWTKEPQPDGTVLYVGDTAKEDNFDDAFYIQHILSCDENFGKYCSKWIGFDNDDDESLPFTDSDVLAATRESGNPLFQ